MKANEYSHKERSSMLKKCEAIGREKIKKLANSIKVSDVPAKAKNFGISISQRTLRYYITQKFIRRPFREGRYTFYDSDYIFSTLITVDQLSNMLYEFPSLVKKSEGRGKFIEIDERVYFNKEPLKKITNKDKEVLRKKNSDVIKMILDQVKNSETREKLLDKILWLQKLECPAEDKIVHIVRMARNLNQYLA